MERAGEKKRHLHRLELPRLPRTALIIVEREVAESLPLALLVRQLIAIGTRAHEQLELRRDFVLVRQHLRGFAGVSVLVQESCL